MSPRVSIDTDVYSAAIARLLPLYEDGHRLVLSFSAGKDSGTCLELMIEAATIAGRLPVEVVMRDDEIMLPGTFEYAQRCYDRDEVEMYWMTARQPIINAFNREQPYLWCFDPLLDPEAWVRPMPPHCQVHPTNDIQSMTTLERCPPAEGKQTFSVIGLRVSESRGRMFGLYSSGGYLTKPNKYGVRGCRPIYDWSDSDVWKAHADRGWDYSTAYDTMYRLGIPKRMLRLAPPTMNADGVDLLRVASQAWPQWFDKVCERAPGIRLAAQFGKRAVSAERRPGESWEDCYHREVTGPGNPEWIRQRGRDCERLILSAHKRHSTQPLPDVARCPNCSGTMDSWKNLARHMYLGDPFSIRATMLPYVEPEVFRPGAGTWSGAPT